MRPFIQHSASRGRRGFGDRRIAVPEIAGNFDDLARTADWVPFGTPASDVECRGIGDCPPPGELGRLGTRAVSLHAS